jgi:hypothetical protein
MIASLAYSGGSTWNPPGSEIQECAPLTMLPSGVSTTSSPRQDSSPYDENAPSCTAPPGKGLAMLQLTIYR